MNVALTNAQVTATLVSAGVPWQTAIKHAAGWDDEDVAEAEQVRAQTITAGNTAGAALLAAFNQASPATE